MRLRLLKQALTFAGLAAGLLMANPADAETLSAPKAEAVTVKSKTGIKWNIRQEGVVVKLNGKKLGHAAKLNFSRTRPGTHEIHLIRGGDEEILEFRIAKGHVVNFTYRFND